MTARAVAALLVGLALGLLLTTFGATLMRVDGGSMAPTLIGGQVVVVLRPALSSLLVGVGLTQPLASDGAVVALVDPQAAALPTAGPLRTLLARLWTPLLVKRIVALPGQTVAYQDGRRLLDGVAAPESWVKEAYAGHFQVSATRLGQGELFVVGDDRLPLASRDSRTFGPISAAALRGAAIAVVRWPRHAGGWRSPLVPVR